MLFKGGLGGSSGLGAWRIRRLPSGGLGSAQPEATRQAGHTTSSVRPTLCSKSLLHLRVYIQLNSKNFHLYQGTQNMGYDSTKLPQAKGSTK